MGKSHQSPIFHSPEKEHSNFVSEDPSLTFTPVRGSRDEAETNNSPDKVEDIHVADSVKKPWTWCPICPDNDGYCHCGSCEECDYVKTEEGLNIHIMNQHEPHEVYNYYGGNWLKAHIHIIHGSLDHYFNQKWKRYL